MAKSAVMAATFALAACGNQGGGSIAGMVRGAASGIIGGEEPSGGASPATSPEDLRALAAQSSAQYVTVPAVGVAVGVIPVSVNGPKVTWSSGNMLVTTQSGFLLSTRGLPSDLMAAEVEGFGEALSLGGTYHREMEWVDGRDTVIRRAFTCEVTITKAQTVAVMEQSYTGTIYNDRCVGQGTEFTNEYFIDTTGALRQSRQWVSETVGYLHSHQL